MNKDKILQANVLDIIFENRNKSYGAYTLRKFYNDRLYKALGIVGMLVLVLCLLSFLQPKEKSLLVTTIYDDNGFAAPPKKNDQPEKIDPPKPVTPATPKLQVKTQAFTTVQIVPDNRVTHSVSTLDSSAFGTHNIPGKPGITVPVTPVTLPAGTADSSHVVKPIDQTTPTGFAEVMPSFPGGVDALQAFLQKNLENPDELKEGQSVSVRIRFVVGYDGKLKSFETAQDGGAPFNNEVIRVLKKMPQWIPGKTHGENVSVYYVLPVKFISTE